MSTMITNVPFRTVRNSAGVVTIEKHYAEMNPNCGLGILVVIIAIILPLSFIATAPVASIVLFITSTLFPGIPLFLVNKMWQIEIDNATRVLKIVRWHEFNNVNKKTTNVKFDEIREIVAETSPDGVKRRLVAILLSGTRHVLYETMNMVHADRFRLLFMGAIQLQAAQVTTQTTQATLATQATQGSQGSQPGSQSSGPADPTVVVPSLRQFAIPDPSAPAGSNAGFQDIPPASPIRVPSWISGADDVDDVDDVDASTSTQGYQAAPASPPSAVPSTQGAEIAPQEDDEAVHKRLLAIAQRKRDILARVYQPGTEPQDAPAAPAIAAVGAPASDGDTSAPLRNKEDWYNKFDDVGGFAYLSSPELGGGRPAGAALASGALETRAGRAPKKKAGDDDDDDDKVITHSVDWRTERELGVHKVRPTCMVCTRPLKGTTFICPTCETKYCIRCARTLSVRKEYCWTCRKPLKVP